MGRIAIVVERKAGGEVSAGVMFPDSVSADGLTHLAQALHAAISQGCGCARDFTAEPTVRLMLDSADAMADLQLLAESADRLPKLRQALLDLGDFSTEVSLLQGNVHAAPGAGDLCFVLQLPERVRELAAATRAGEFDGV